MQDQVIGRIPEFTSDVPTEDAGDAEVKQAVVEESTEEGEETPLSSPPVEEESEEVSPELKDEIQPDETDIERALQGLQNERAKLLKEISELKGKRRELKSEELQSVEDRLDELNDVNPEDIALIDRVIRHKGYVTKDEAGSMFYEAVKQEELGKFMERYPEYREENDQNDVNWSTLLRELSYYKKPGDPHIYAELLERAHRNIARLSPNRVAPVKRRQAEIASVGSGGSQRSSSSSHQTLSAEKRVMLQNGGWTDAEIDQIEKRLN